MSWVFCTSAKAAMAVMIKAEPPGTGVQGSMCRFGRRFVAARKGFWAFGLRESICVIRDADALRFLTVCRLLEYPVDRLEALALPESCPPDLERPSPRPEGMAGGQER